ncbi:MAG: aspartate 1-decarboxylase [Gammaproteobacteria bacterium]|nr:aspartate 1-decarboxylase [Gammaproteobacteria bacterium]MCH9762864.1 aspartate 1-decarboxylase [Gammaproteobacteria bacterium]
MQYRRMLKSKIHRATITHADLNYEGSITLSPQLLEAADLLPHEAVSIWNITAGTRFETYTIEGKSHSKSVCVNGAAARLVSPGDLIIIASFTQIEESLCRALEPTVVFVDEQNQIREMRAEIAACVDT